MVVCEIGYKTQNNSDAMMAQVNNDVMTTQDDRAMTPDNEMDDDNMTIKDNDNGNKEGQQQVVRSLRANLHVSLKMCISMSLIDPFYIFHFPVCCVVEYLAFFSNVVYICVPTVSKAQSHPKRVCPIQLISVRFDRGKLFRSVRTI